MKTKKVSKMGKKRQIVLTSIELFLSKGFSIVTMDCIARELNISKKTLYKYFNSKDELIFYSVNFILRIIERKLYLIHNNDRLDELEKFQFTVEFVVENLYNINIQYFRDLAIRYKYIWKYIDEFRQKRLVSILHKTFENMKTKDMIRDNVDIDFIVLVLRIILMNIANPEQIIKNKIDYRNLATQIYELLFNGILKSGSDYYEKIFFNDDIFSILMY